MTRAESPDGAGWLFARSQNRLLYPAGAGGQRGSTGNNAQVGTAGTGSTRTAGMCHLWCRGRVEGVLKSGVVFSLRLRVDLDTTGGSIDFQFLAIMGS